jgi:hypothetical protein
MIYLYQSKGQTSEGVVEMNGYIQAINKPSEEHLEEVMKIAAEIGFVQLNTYFTGEEYFLLEGSHRIEAAVRLQLPLILKLRNWDEEVESDVDDCNTAGEIVDSINWSRAGNVYNSDQFVSVEVIG